MWELQTDYERMFVRILEGVRAYLKGFPNLRALVLGVSGGIDSGLTCALAHEATEPLQGVRLISRNLPIESNTEAEISRAEAVGRLFSDDYQKRDLTRAYQGLYSEIVLGTDRAKADSRAEKVRRGNLKTRVRMTYLFDLAHLSEGMVLSTDNYTEFLLGFWTLHGDVGNYGMLQFLWKTEVYGLAGFLVNRYEADGRPDRADALRQCVEAVPTDGLGITASDFDQIGVRDYETADRMLLRYLNGEEQCRDHPLIVRHLQSEFKRRDPQFIGREDLFS